MSASRTAFRLCSSARISKKHRPAFDTDDCALPRNPTWSVDELLSSYPKPTIDSKTLDHLRRLSALTPPEEGSEARQQLTQQLEDLVKLVEAVKMVDTRSLASTEGTSIPDGRIWAEGAGIEIQGSPRSQEEGDVLDQAKLLSYAARTENGLYLVDADRKNKK
ncbi:hypothetical protein DENSPDRAFT_855880 [Dentipellis sp. KUC8613]|nr:hypothetical protein DENSPDRAFT_855880 [Dentipellis sp. KUC8613]